MEIFDGVFLGNKNTAKDAHFFQENRIAFVVNCTKDVRNHFEGLSSIQKMVHKSRVVNNGDSSPSRASSCSSSSCSSISDLSDDLSSIPSTPSRSSPQNSLPSTPNSSQKEVLSTKLDFATENPEIESTTAPATETTQHLLVQPALLDEQHLHLHNEQLNNEIPATPTRPSSQSSTATPSRRKDPSKYTLVVYEFANKVHYFSIKIEDSWEHDISKFFDHGADFIANCIAENKSTSDTTTTTTTSKMEGEKLSLNDLMEMDGDAKDEDPFAGTQWEGLPGLPKLNANHTMRVCTLVHCREGRSRSVSISIAYAMKYLKWTLKQAYEYLKLATRDHIRINDGFKRQLMEYEKKVLQVEENSMTFFGHRESKKRSRQSYCELHEDDIQDEDYETTRETETKRKRRRHHKHNLPAASSIAALIQATKSHSKAKQITLFSMFKKKEEKKIQQQQQAAAASSIPTEVKPEEVTMDSSTPLPKQDKVLVEDVEMTSSVPQQNVVETKEKSSKVVEDTTLKSKKMKQTNIASFFSKKK